jgi:hypothetical protein
MGQWRDYCNYKILGKSSFKKKIHKDFKIPNRIFYSSNISQHLGMIGFITVQGQIR